MSGDLTMYYFTRDEEGNIIDTRHTLLTRISRDLAMQYVFSDCYDMLFLT
jgi:hypothetical protein